MPAQRLLLEIQLCNRRSKTATGDIDPPAVAALLGSALAQPDRELLLLELGEYLATAVDGTALAPETWRPLEHFPGPASF